MAIVSFDQIVFDDELEHSPHMVRSATIATQRSAPETMRVLVVQILHYGDDANAQRDVTTAAIKESTRHLMNESDQVVGYCVHEKKFYPILRSFDFITLVALIAAANRTLTPPEWVSQVVTWCLQIATELSRLRDQGYVAAEFGVQNVLQCRGLLLVICNQARRLGSTYPETPSSTAADKYRMGIVVHQIIALRAGSSRSFPIEFQHLFESLLSINQHRTLSDIITSLSNHPQCIPWSRLADWLRSDADECATLTEALQKLVDTCDLPVTRQELSGDLNQLQNHFAIILERRAIKLYTCNSPVYKLVNAFLTSSSNGEQHLLWHYSRRCTAARVTLQRRMRPVRASRFVACKSESTRRQLENYATCFEVGTVLTAYQFESFTAADDLPSFNVSNVERIIYRCNNLVGYDVSQISPIPSEREVLVLPPAWFTVTKVEPHFYCYTNVVEFVEVDVDYSDRPP
ncbi:Hypothetical protein, putative [Bodo saltans]|uniref:Uncharacterized protein n=1 Tax=Bodo saltans TaxID=75058 RepID=A0A0S4IVD6_BODSA|nr:Hypothetical protein, putative [Bodo saltans]|eukprot:CUF56551.1 Hypothetical protein, putative [Bodo saltans]